MQNELLKVPRTLTSKNLFKDLQNILNWQNLSWKIYWKHWDDSRLLGFLFALFRNVKIQWKMNRFRAHGPTINRALTRENRVYIINVYFRDIWIVHLFINPFTFFVVFIGSLIPFALSWEWKNFMISGCRLSKNHIQSESEKRLPSYCKQKKHWICITVGLFLFLMRFCNE